jgi:hypothetical protein
MGVHWPHEGLSMHGRGLGFVFLICAGTCVFALPSDSQTPQEETLAGPDAHEAAEAAHGHLFGDWGECERGC